jgi:uncharacterized membrane protein YkvA (DUF1232 family)
MPSTLARWKLRARQLQAEVYALSPIDLIPDFIPVLGYLDDLRLIPLGSALVLRMIPPVVMVECRARARAELVDGKPVGRAVATVIVANWLVLAATALLLIARTVK